MDGKTTQQSSPLRQTLTSRDKTYSRRDQTSLWLSKNMESPYYDPHRNIANYFYFVCPENLISLNEIPEYSGLIYILDVGAEILMKYGRIKSKERTIKEIKQAPLIHKKKAEGKLIRRIAQTLSAKQIFGCSYMSYKVKQNQKILIL